MHSYKHLIFDFGGVILDIRERIKSGGYAADIALIFGVSRDEAEKIWKEERRRVIMGQITARQFLAIAKKRFGSEADLDEALELWDGLQVDSDKYLDRQLLAYIEELGKRYRIHLFTNMVSLGKRDARVKELGRYFENVFRSYEEGVTKEDKEAFIHVMKKMGAKPEECVFVDDHQPFVDAAKAAGIDAILYKDLAELKKEFAKRGITA